MKFNSPMQLRKKLIRVEMFTVINFLANDLIAGLKLGSYRPPSPLDWNVTIYKMNFPEHPDDPPLSAGQIRQCFGEFLKFLKFNLAGQTALQVDGAWASQTKIIQGFCKFAAPHMIVRADSLEEDLKLLTQQVGLSWQNPPPASLPQSPALSEIYDTELEAFAREAYAADYSNFGFKPLEF